MPQFYDGGSQQTVTDSERSCMHSQSNTNNADQNQETGNVRDNSGESSTLAYINTDQTSGHLQNGNCSEDRTLECVVCQTNKVTIAILPCRHTCICDLCLEQLDKCPMCRGYIMSYFRIEHNVDSDSVYPGHNNKNTRRNSRDRSRQPGESRWEFYNRRLNEFLGFE